MKQILTLLILIIYITPHLYASYKIKIQGKVTELATNKAIRNVNIASQGSLLGITDVDGKFSIQAAPDAELLFNVPGYNDVVVKIDNRQVLNIQMTEREIEIPEIVILGKEQNKKISAEPTDLEVRGNYFHLKTKFRAPSAIFKSDQRFIVQPTLYNATTKNYAYFRPVVIDGKFFEMNNARVNGFNLQNDSLISYQVPNDLKKQDYIYAYYDSLYVPPAMIDHDFRAECYLAVNAFVCHKHDYLDTVVIARGTKNPLRFISYGFTPYELTDSSFYPRPEMNLMTERGISRIRFDIGKYSIDISDSINVAEIQRIARTISGILSNEDATIRSVTAIGYTSPDGNYEANKALAHKRTSSVMNEIVRLLPASHKPYIAFETSSKVENWATVSALILHDSLAWGAKFDSVVRNYNNDFSNCQWALKKMPEYKSIVVEEYLPRLRRTEYMIEYSIFRNLKDEEIMERYHLNKRPFSRYEYWRLTENMPQKQQKTEIAKEALQAYPDFMLLANKYAIHLIQSDSFNTSVLRPAIEKDAPWEIKYNQAIMALGTREYALADSLCNALPEIDDIAYLKSINAALNGRYTESYPIIASKGGLNEVLILLCMNRNKDAEQKITTLLDLSVNAENAHYWYVRAVCANRNDNLTIAMESLRRALSLNASLKEVARLDSDIMDILELVDFEN